MWSSLSAIIIALFTAITAYLKTVDRSENNAKQTLEELRKAQKSTNNITDVERKRLRDKYGYK